MVLNAHLYAARLHPDIEVITVEMLASALAVGALVVVLFFGHVLLEAVAGAFDLRTGRERIQPLVRRNPFLRTPSAPPPEELPAVAESNQQPALASVAQVSQVLSDNPRAMVIREGFRRLAILGRALCALPGAFLGLIIAGERGWDIQGVALLAACAAVPFLTVISQVRHIRGRACTDSARSASAEAQWAP